MFSFYFNNENIIETSIILIKVIIFRRRKIIRNKINLGFVESSGVVLGCLWLGENLDSFCGYHLSPSQ
jgi:hypothetical protein